MATERHIIWDFDGTLGQRDGMWLGALMEVLHSNGIRPDITTNDLRPFLAAGFRWHNAHIKNLPATPAEQWWSELEPLFESAFRQGANVPEVEAKRLAKEVRTTFSHPPQWKLFPDTRHTLELLAAQGWRQILLTNHVPELPSILQSLDIQHYFAAVFNSADTGVEKPHPEAFENVLSSLSPKPTVWMIGDNFTADVQGAEAVGIPAILVRKPHPTAKWYSGDLAGVIAILEKAESH